jgi:RNA polymerase sigma factor (sigma-70 family)
MPHASNSQIGNATAAHFEAFSGQASPDRSLLISEDMTLVARVLTNDLCAIEQLFIQRCGQQIAYLSIKYCHEDLLGELYIHLRQDDWRRLRTWQGRSSIKSWVEMVAVRICLYRVKDLSRFEPLGNWANILQADGFGSQEVLARNAEINDVLEAIEKLERKRDKRVMYSLILNEMDLNEIAAELQISTDKAYVVKCRAIKRVKQLIEQ